MGHLSVHSRKLRPQEKRGDTHLPVHGGGRYRDTRCLKKIEGGKEEEKVHLGNRPTLLSAIQSTHTMLCYATEMAKEEEEGRSPFYLLWTPKGLNSNILKQNIMFLKGIYIISKQAY